MKTTESKLQHIFTRVLLSSATYLTMQTMDNIEIYTNLSHVRKKNARKNTLN